MKSKTKLNSALKNVPKNSLGNGYFTLNLKNGKKTK